VKVPTVSIPELRTLLADAKRPMTAAEIAEAHFGQTDRELIDYVNGRLSTESRKPANKPNQIVKIEKPGHPSLYWTVENYRTPEPLPAMVPVERAPAPTAQPVQFLIRLSANSLSVGLDGGQQVIITIDPSGCPSVQMGVAA
jgi:hypothetical protein